MAVPPSFRKRRGALLPAVTNSPWEEEGKGFAGFLLFGMEINVSWERKRRQVFLGL